MTNTKHIGKYLFQPIIPALCYLFFAITTLHEKIDLLRSLHVESLTLLATVVLTIVQIFWVKKEKISYSHAITQPFLMAMIYILPPMITSLINQDPIFILYDQEYITLLKMALFVPCLYWLITQNNQKELILNSTIAFYVVLGVYFLYRYLVLNEVREFDLRPALKIRHGDANFLCAFFIMIAPLPLMQFIKAKKNNQKLYGLAFIAASIFLIVCAYLTESRMGLVAGLVGLVYLLTRPIWPISRGVLLAMVILIGTLLIAFSGERVMTRFSELNDKSNSDRVLTWTNGLKVFEKNPIIGVGIHNAPKYFYQNTGYPPFQTETRPLEVHNTFLKVAAELGIIGFIFITMVFMWPWLKSIKSQSSDRYFLLSSLIILTLSSLAIGIPYKDLFLLHIFLIVSLSQPAPREATCK